MTFDDIMYGRVGDTVEAVRFMSSPTVDDNITVPPGTRGTISHIDDAGTRHTRWANGSTIGLLPGRDIYKVEHAKPTDNQERDTWAGLYHEYQVWEEERAAATNPLPDSDNWLASDEDGLDLLRRFAALTARKIGASE